MCVCVKLCVHFVHLVRMRALGTQRQQQWRRLARARILLVITAPPDYVGAAENYFQRARKLCAYACAPALQHRILILTCTICYVTEREEADKRIWARSRSKHLICHKSFFVIEHIDREARACSCTCSCLLYGADRRGRDAHQLPFRA